MVRSGEWAGRVRPINLGSQGPNDIRFVSAIQPA